MKTNIYENEWAQLCWYKILFMDTNILILYNFYMSQNIMIFFFIPSPSPQLFKRWKPVLCEWHLNQKAGWIWLIGHSLLTPGFPEPSFLSRLHPAGPVLGWTVLG